MHVQTVAEKEAWRLAKEEGLDLVAVLPNFVLGPVVSSRADGTSVGFLKVLLPCQNSTQQKFMFL